MNPTAWRFQKNEMAARLTRWANINSGSGHAAGLDRMRSTLFDEFATLPGAAVESAPLPGTPAQALIARARPQAPLQILFSGHYDTVYGATHPFQRCERLDARRLRGPGVADMKGGLLLMLETLRAFESLPEAAHLGWEAILTPDEETGSVASAGLLAAAAPRFRLALVFEPARPSGNLVRARKGTGIFTATCRGRAAHAGRDPKQGRNAILALAEFLLAAEKSVGAVPDALINVGAIQGGGAVNIVPDLASADMNIRISRRADEAAVRTALDAAAAPINGREGFRLEVAGAFNRPPKEITPDETTWFARWKACAAAEGVSLDWEDVGGGSDGNLLSAAGLSCLDGLGPIGDHLHSPEEVVDLDSLVQRAQIATRFLSELASSQ